jgi:hypothetical protein
VTFKIGFTRFAATGLRQFRKPAQEMILDAIEDKLCSQPVCKAPDIGWIGKDKYYSWVLRVIKYKDSFSPTSVQENAVIPLFYDEQYIVFYDVLLDGEERSVKVKGLVEIGQPTIGIPLVTSLKDELNQLETRPDFLLSLQKSSGEGIKVSLEVLRNELFPS